MPQTPTPVCPNPFAMSTATSDITHFALFKNRAKAKRLIDALRCINVDSQFDQIKRETDVYHVTGASKFMKIQPPRIVAKYLLALDRFDFEYEKGCVVFVLEYRKVVSKREVKIDWSFVPPYPSHYEGGEFILDHVRYNFWQMRVSWVIGLPSKAQIKLSNTGFHIIYNKTHYDVDRFNGLYYVSIPIDDGRRVRVPFDPYDPHQHAPKIESVILACQKDDIGACLDFISNHNSVFSIFNGVFVNDTPLTFF